MASVPIPPSIAIDLALHVKLKNNLLQDYRYNDVMTAIITRISQLPNFQNYRACLETLLFACNLAENLVLASDTIDKNMVVCDALTQVFNLTEPEIIIMKNSINFMCSHGRVKKFSKWFFLVMRIYNFVVGK